MLRELAGHTPSTRDVCDPSMYAFLLTPTQLLSGPCYSTPSPPLARWPLTWSYQALKFTDWFYAKHTGMDTVVYVRFLRACSEYLAQQL